LPTCADMSPVSVTNMDHADQRPFVHAGGPLVSSHAIVRLRSRLRHRLPHRLHLVLHRSHHLPRLARHPPPSHQLLRAPCRLLS
jgi:hypothetical protein